MRVCTRMVGGDREQDRRATRDGAHSFDCKTVCFLRQAARGGVAEREAPRTGETISFRGSVPRCRSRLVAAADEQGYGAPERSGGHAVPCEERVDLEDEFVPRREGLVEPKGEAHGTWAGSGDLMIIQDDRDEPRH